jgi:hypothetical protein
MKLSLLFQREQLFLSTTDLHVKNKVASLEEHKHGQGKYEEQFVTMISLKGMYKDVHLHGLVVLQGLLLDVRKIT